jgi:hypothetical protein
LVRGQRGGEDESERCGGIHRFWGLRWRCAVVAQSRDERGRRRGLIGVGRGKNASACDVASPATGARIVHGGKSRE